MKFKIKEQNDKKSVKILDKKKNAAQLYNVIISDPAHLQKKKKNLDHWYHHTETTHDVTK